MLILAGFFFLGSVVLVPPELTVGAGGAPWPDGVEPLDVAVSLTRDGDFGIHLAGQSHPSRYPIGFAILQAGALVLGVDPASAPHRANQVVGLFLLVLVGGVLWWRSRPLEAGLAVLFVATLPMFVLLARSPLSDLFGSFVLIGGVCLLHEYARTRSVVPGIVGAVLLGLSVGVRTSNVLFFGFLPAAVASHRGLSWRIRSRELSLLCVAALGGLLPTLVYATFAFGDPLSTGYSYWIPSWGPSNAFQLQFVPVNFEYVWRELLDRETAFTTANLFGNGSYVGWAAVPFLLVSFVARRNDRRFWCFLSAGLVPLLLLFAYFFQDLRLFLPLFLMAAPVAAVGIVRLFQAPGVGARTGATIVALLYASSVFGWPSRSGGPESLAFLTSSRPASAAYRLTHQFQRFRTTSPRLVLTDLPPPYLHALLPAETTVAPLYDDHLFRFRPDVFTCDRSARRRLVDEALTRGDEVWAVVHDRPIAEIDSAHEAPRGFVWDVVARAERTGIARLVELPARP